MSTILSELDGVVRRAARAVPFPRSEETGTAWDQGGCQMFAKALRAVFGGRIMAVCSRDAESDDYPVEHFVLERDGLCWGSTGIRPGSEVLARFQKRCREQGPFTLRNPRCRNVWSGAHFWDEKLHARLVKELVRGRSHSKL